MGASPISTTMKSRRGDRPRIWKGPELVRRVAQLRRSAMWYSLSGVRSADMRSGTLLVPDVEFQCLGDFFGKCSSAWPEFATAALLYWLLSG